jgi:ElaB/YqjD/DUF883 family membrane-anchored ribosome-binding protein
LKSNGACGRWKSVWNVLVSERPQVPRRLPSTETVAAALSSMADRFRGGANLMGDEAAKIGSEAAKLGNDALRRLSKEVEHRPLLTLAVAVGVGILVGLVSHRR